MAYFRHEKAIVDTDCVGEGTRIWEFSHVLPGAKIGENCNICAHTFIENEVVLGDNVTVKSGVYIWDGVYIEDNVFLGPNVTFTNDLRPRSKKYPAEYEKTVIEKGASIGANATLIGGVSVGKYAMVGAGAVVTKSIPNNTLWYGNPAVFKGYICDCGESLSDSSLCCGSCGSQYVVDKNKMISKKS